MTRSFEFLIVMIALRLRSSRLFSEATRSLSAVFQHISELNLPHNFMNLTKESQTTTLFVARDYLTMIMLQLAKNKEIL